MQLLDVNQAVHITTTVLQRAKLAACFILCALSS